MNLRMSKESEDLLKFQCRKRDVAHDAGPSPHQRSLSGGTEEPAEQDAGWEELNVLNGRDARLEEENHAQRKQEEGTQCDCPIPEGQPPSDRASKQSAVQSHLLAEHTGHQALQSHSWEDNRLSSRHIRKTHLRQRKRRKSGGFFSKSFY